MRLEPTSASGDRLIREVVIDGDEFDLLPITWLSERDGEIAVAQEQDSRVLFFDPTGMLIGSAGHRGSGPGEFRSLSEGGWLGDSLWIYDAHLGRVTLLALGASGARRPSRTVWSLAQFKPTDPSTLRFNEVVPRGLDRDHSVLATGYGSSENDLRGQYLVSVGPDGRFHGIIAQLPPNTSEIRTRTAGAFFLTKLRFGAAPLVDVSPDGGVIAVAHVGSEEGVPSFSVTLISADGDTIYHHEHQYTPAAIQESVRRTEEARIAKRKSQVPGFPDVTVPRFYPPLRSLIAGRDSCVWIELDGASGQRS